MSASPDSESIGTVEWIESLALALLQYKFNFSNEKDLQSGLSMAFAKIGHESVRELHLSKKDIVDFYFPKMKVGVEVKIGGSLSNLTRQVHRYVQHDEISGMLVVTSKPKLSNLPETINGKPVLCHSLIASLI